MVDPIDSTSTPLSQYKTDRAEDGHLVLVMPWPTKTVLGCAGRTLVIATGAALIATFGNAPGLYGMSVFTCLFAVIVISMTIIANRRGWVLRRGFIKPVPSYDRSDWSRIPWLGVRSVVLRREVWPGGRGSTDIVLVTTDGSKPLKVISVYNWEGGESRLGSGGMGSLARSGPTVPSAAAPLLAIPDSNLKAAVSGSVREIADLAVHELGVGIEFECEQAHQSPDAVG